MCHETPSALGQCLHLRPVTNAETVTDGYQAGAGCHFLMIYLNVKRNTVRQPASQPVMLSYITDTASPNSTKWKLQALSADAIGGERSRKGSRCQTSGARVTRWLPQSTCLWEGLNMCIRWPELTVAVPAPRRLDLSVAIKTCLCYACHSVSSLSTSLQ